MTDDANGVDTRYRVEQRGLALADEISGIDEPLADKAADRRADRGVAQVELRLDDCGLGGRDSRAGGLQIRDGVVVVLLGHGSPLGQGLQAPLVGFGLAESRLGTLELRLGLQQLRFVFARVEREQQLVLLDDRALGEVLRGEVRLHPGADLHRFLGLDLRDVLAVDRYRLLDDLGDDYGRRRRGGARLFGLVGFLALVAGGQRHDQRYDTERRHRPGPRPVFPGPLQHGHLTLLLAISNTHA